MNLVLCIWTNNGCILPGDTVPDPKKPRIMHGALIMKDNVSGIVSGETLNLEKNINWIEALYS